jgi:transcriptional regulator with XRE-family HTH domain
MSETLSVMDFFIQLASDIRQFRKDNDWSQQQLADMTGLDRTTISALERNNFNEIGIRKVQRILQVLNYSLSIEAVGLPTLDDMQRLNKGVG